MNRKCILITGAGGYLGRHVTRDLSRSADVIAVDFHKFEVPPGANFLQCDIFKDDLPAMLNGTIPDVCLHLAWQDGFSHNALSHMEMLSSHFAFLRSMISFGVHQIAVMGSMHEVGYREGMISEDTPCRPLSLYGTAKNALRQALELYCSREHVIFQWLRGFYIYGDDRNNHSVFTRLLEAEAAGKSEFPFTSGKNRYDFISVDALAHQISACVLQTEVAGIIACCTGGTRSLGEMAEEFIRKNDMRIKLKYGAFPDRPYDSPAVWGDASKIKKILEAEKR